MRVLEHASSESVIFRGLGACHVNLSALEASLSSRRS